MFDKQSLSALQVPRSVRQHPVEVYTSMPAGKFTPLAVVPLLREDALRTMRVGVRCEMGETHDLLINPVYMRIRAIFIPWLAMERFQGSRDQFDRSYMGEAQIDGGSLVPFIEEAAAGTVGANKVHKYLGLHARAAQNINTMYNEAYNCAWNYLAENVSKEITARTRLENTTLAQAFWHKRRFWDIVPDFDKALLDGEIAWDEAMAGAAMLASVNVSGGNLQVKTAASSLRDVMMQTTNALNYSGAAVGANTAVADVANLKADLSAFVDAIVAGGMRLTLANIQRARQTQMFARLRQKYQGLDEEWIVDMLMSGMTIADQNLKQPVVLDEQLVRFAQAKRYATDSGNLAESAVSGAAAAMISVRVPRVATGGMVMLFGEAFPEQLFERQAEPFFHTNSVAELPDYLRDVTDSQKVEFVTNEMIDVDHATPSGVFGYRPLNARFNTWGTMIGGDMFRPAVDGANDANRRNFWAVEVANPNLNEDWYLVPSDIGLEPFLVDTVDPFKVWVSGGAVIEGNTVFGGPLLESGGNWDAVEEKVPDQADQIDPDA